LLLLSKWAAQQDINMRLPHPFKTTVAIAALLYSLMAAICQAEDATNQDSNTSQTSIYRETDSKGAPVFTDQPTPTAKPVELEPINTSEKPPNIPSRQSESAAVIRYSISLSTPTSTTVIPNTLAGVPVKVTVSPALEKGMTVEILLDGRSAQEGGTTSFTLYGVNSGTHSVEALLKRGSNVISRSQPVSFTAIRPGGGKSAP
jgi:hypothetical protein